MATRLLNAQDYDKIAQEVVQDFMQQSKPLDESVASKARDMELNPEQIKNLVHAANALTTLAMMDAKTDGDKYVEFEPADAKTVLGKVYASGDKQAEQRTSASPETNNAEFLGDLESQGLEGCCSNGSDTKDENKTTKSVLIMRIQKAAEELEHQKLAAAHEYREQLDKLAAEFARLYGPDVREFEKDAFDVHGESALPLIADLRRCLRMDAPQSDKFTKTASQKRLVDTDTSLFKTFDSMLKLAKEYNDCAAGMAYLKANAGDIL